jgi:aspartyl-tRNA(Asn)/glutamyl-tRNA(Gln) amidotransferase subunit C
MDEETLARLARLTEDDARDLGPDLARILEYVDRLRAVDVAGVEPFEGAPDEVTRADRPAPGLSRDQALGGAPDRDETHFRVPREPAP